MGRYVDMRQTEVERLQGLLESAQADLINLIREREEIDSRIAQVYTDIKHLAAICGRGIDDPVMQLGLTDAIRYVLFTNRGEPMTLTAIRDYLMDNGYKLDGYSNALASIHTIANRLVVAGEAAAVKQGGIYWNGGPNLKTSAGNLADLIGLATAAKARSNRK